MALEAAQAGVVATGAAAEEARVGLGRLAAESYRRDGGTRLSALGVLLDSGTPADAVLRAEAVRRALHERDETVRRSADAARRAATARQAAAEASRVARDAADAVAAAYRAAADKVGEQERQVQDFAARQTRLVAELAAARGTSVELERQRQEGLAAEAQRRAEEEARRRAEDRAAQARRDEPRRDQGQSRPRPGGSAPVRAGAAAAIAYAKAQLGKPYVWGGEGPDGFDCSGLVMQAWRRAGVELTHFAATQYAESRPLRYADLRPGDLLFWTETPRAQDIHHVAMYLGDGLMIQAPNPGAVVKVSGMFSMGTPDFYARP
ncbi:C40 family peptidase [Yinghuangia seranimata]|uniref:C40 family peptidase n=1 Tax=Yinghuangia seranimata TaxID=408067 RepID=UPI00248B3AF1|nr:C40 family peptidase [Yinghuangia seranimata]MDI2127982.1 C40 family peptidase [Yinghuangia seranimata]